MLVCPWVFALHVTQIRLALVLLTFSFKVIETSSIHYCPSGRVVVISWIAIVCLFVAFRFDLCNIHPCPKHVITSADSAATFALSSFCPTSIGASVCVFTEGAQQYLLAPHFIHHSLFILHCLFYFNSNCCLWSSIQIVTAAVSLVAVWNANRMQMDHLSFGEKSRLAEYILNLPLPTIFVSGSDRRHSSNSHLSSD